MPPRPAPDETPTLSPSSSPTPTTPAPAVTVPLPAFSSSRRQGRTLDPLPEGTTVEPPSAVDVVADFGEPEAPSGRSSDGRRTSSSAGEKADPKVVAGAIAGLIGIVATLAAAVLLRSPRPRQLRTPTEQDCEDIAAPLARIAARHAPAVAVGPDLMDAIAATAAVGRYVQDGPLTFPAHDAGEMPSGDDHPQEN